ncbi:L-threonylcarbamoyladenylate synthase [Acidipropionibacterium virtanenii]|uniref:L-threonylcarbamoyladenylate synthase n=1 Tax=Acidipropionibacterium virtanenii TaxID=2057246 RepID=A0A344UTT1_9ACTN|nr:L-threonylcarbamoyladenylate synthase [Acidipropionibacterium virtanenii]AXE38679.1 Putative threonylcarbamoyl-AMP synthase [Acidipropionibacterium virtanenii]
MEETTITEESDPGERPGAPEVLDVTDPQTRADSLSRAAAALKEGECVVLPTDTVYGIAADALDPLAVQRLLMAKERGRDMPPPVLIGDAAVLPALCDRVPGAARDLAEAFWPGGLTLIFRAQEDLTMDLGETNGTIAVRVPDQDAARDLLRITGPLAVSSANKSGHPAALKVGEALSQLGTSVAVYLDGGPSRIGESSTIIDFASEEAGRVLRQGALSIEDIHRVAPDVLPLAPEPAQEQEEPTEEPAAEDPENGEAG